MSRGFDVGFLGGGNTPTIKMILSLFDASADGGGMNGTFNGAAFPQPTTLFNTPDMVTNAVFSPNGVYACFPTYSQSPYCMLYKRVAGVYTQLAAPPAMPTHTLSCAFSDDSNMLVFVHEYAPYVTVYTIANDTFTKLAATFSPAPTSTCHACSLVKAVSNNYTYLVLGTSVTPFFYVYKFDGVNIFYKEANPATLPAGIVYGARFTPDGANAVTVGANSPFINYYSHVLDVLTRQSITSPIPATGNDCDVSKSGVYVSVAHAGSPFITVYKRSGNTLTKLANPATLPAVTANTCKFTPDAKFLAVAIATSPPTIMVYALNQTTDILTYVGTIPTMANADYVSGIDFTELV